MRIWHNDTKNVSKGLVHPKGSPNNEDDEFQGVEGGPPEVTIFSIGPLFIGPLLKLGGSCPIKAWWKPKFKKTGVAVIANI